LRLKALIDRHPKSLLRGLEASPHGVLGMKRTHELASVAAILHLAIELVRLASHLW
jgi:hypothetical protein